MTAAGSYSIYILSPIFWLYVTQNALGRVEIGHIAEAELILFVRWSHFCVAVAIKKFHIVV